MGAVDRDRRDAQFGDGFAVFVADHRPLGDADFQSGDLRGLENHVRCGGGGEANGVLRVQRRHPHREADVHCCARLGADMDIEAAVLPLPRVGTRTVDDQRRFVHVDAGQQEAALGVGAAALFPDLHGDFGERFPVQLEYASGECCYSGRCLQRGDGTGSGGFTGDPVVAVEVRLARLPGVGTCGQHFDGWRRRLLSGYVRLCTRP